MNPHSAIGADIRSSAAIHCPPQQCQNFLVRLVSQLESDGHLTQGTAEGLKGRVTTTDVEREYLAKNPVGGGPPPLAVSIFDCSIDCCQVPIYSHLNNSVMTQSSISQETLATTITTTTTISRPTLFLSPHLPYTPGVRRPLTCKPHRRLPRTPLSWVLLGFSAMQAW